GLFRERDSLEAWAAFVSDRRNLRALDLGTVTQIGNGPALHRHGDFANMTYFACAAGVGLDGEIARNANVLPRWLRAHGGYALSLPLALLRFRPFALQLSTDESYGEFTPRSSQFITD